MPPKDPHKLVRDTLRTKQFDAVYLFHGEDDFLKDQALRQILDGAVDPATRDFNLEIRRAADLTAETLGSLLATPPMMAERRVLVVRDPGALRKDARTTLDRYLAKPAPDAIVLLVAPAGGKVDKALLDRTTVVEFQPLTGDRVPKWIAFHTESVHGAAISPGAAALLQDAVGNELTQLALEIEKLASYAAGRTIEEADVAAVVGVRREETTGAFLDAVAARDAVGALDRLPILLQQPKQNGVVLVMALSTQMLAIGYALALRERGTSVNRLPTELFALLKETGGYTGRAWGEAVSCWTRAAASGQWTAADVDRALRELLIADRALKETRVSSDEQLLGSLVLALCAASTRRGRAAA